MPDAPAPASLEDVLADAWAHLLDATTTAKHGFHLPTLCTTPLHFDPTRDAPHARIVVLRDVTPPNPEAEQPASVVAHTDLRSPKASELRAYAQGAWVFYDGPSRLQLRVAGPSEVLTFASTGDDLALVEQRWNASTPSSKRCYLAPQAPGTPADAPSPNLPAAFRKRIPASEAESDPGKANFALIRTRVATLDVLHLHHAGHQRACFSFAADGQIEDQAWLEV
ncbi:MAG: hypothetical protein AAGF84_00580 [Planctomycetota bacterium]